MMLSASSSISCSHRFPISPSVWSMTDWTISGHPGLFIPFRQLDHTTVPGGREAFLGGFFNMGQGVFHRAVERMLGYHHLLVLATLAARSAASLIPFSRTGRDFDHPDSHIFWDSLSMLMMSPFFRTISIMFTAMTMGCQLYPAGCSGTDSVPDWSHPRCSRWRRPFFAEWVRTPLLPRCRGRGNRCRAGPG